MGRIAYTRLGPVFGFCTWGEEHTGAKAASGLLEKLRGIGRETFLDALKGVSQVARSREMHASNDSGIVTYSKGSGFGLL